MMYVVKTGGYNVYRDKSNMDGLAM